MALPVNPRDLLRIGNQLTAERDKPVGIAVVVEVDAPDDLLIALQEVLVPRTARASISVGVAGQDGQAVPPETDVIVFLLGSGGPAVAASLAAARQRSIPAITLALTGVSTSTPASAGQPLDDFLECDDATFLVREELARRIADHVSAKRLALAANFDFMRPAVAGEYMRQTAWQNALIGGVTIIPGADLPLMTGNQAKMVLQMAAAYGQHLDGERAKELLAVVGAGLTFRALARQLLDFVPGFGWALKAGIGYTGTIAVGKAAITYFEHGADISSVVAGIESEALTMAEKVLPAGEGARRGLFRRARREPLPAPEGSSCVADVPPPAQLSLEASDEGAGA